MIPIVAGLLMGAAMGGGIAALQGKDVLQGALMGGAGGALGGVLMPAAGGIMGGTEGAIAGSTGSTAVTPVATEGITSALADPTSMFSGGSLTTGGTANLGLKTAGSQALMPSTMGVPANVTAGTGLTVPPSIANAAGGAGSGGVFGSGGIGNFLSANKGALMGGAVGGMMAPGEKPPSPEQGNIREFDFNPGERNSLFGNPGETYYKGRGFTEGKVTPVEDYDKANGGIIALAEGGQADRYKNPAQALNPAVAAYNAQIMERANQQYNINNRPGPNQVPGSAGYVAPTVTEKPKEPRVYTDLINNPEGKSKVDLSDEELYKELDARYGNNNNDDTFAASSRNANGGLMRGYNEGGISSLGNYSDGGQLLKGPGDGVSDSIPARIGARQPARLADGEFVVPARIVSEIGNGSTDAGAKRLYAMMDRVQNNRKKSIGKGKVAVDSKAHRMLPA